ncbi:DNA-binding protein modulo-like [Drosophila eugracilis]|uniref:DNA-binding protein modulo-like n=1 Tax=Drosophila eugracilis TaxID=29029 RepID=UPI001BD997E4|nr:DNA-binding protein modulo-like [Drosophila eugracilis]
MTVPPLRAKLSKLGLDTTGRKGALQDRLFDHYALDVAVDEDGEADDYQEVVQPSSSRFTLRDIQDSVSSFSGSEQEDVNHWLSEFDDVAVTNELDYSVVVGNDVLQSVDVMFSSNGVEFRAKKRDFALTFNGMCVTEIVEKSSVLDKINLSHLADNQKLKVQEEEKQIAATQSSSKRTRKQPVKKVPPSSEEESDAEEQIDDQVEVDSDSEAEESADLIDDEAEEDEDENSDEEEDDDEKVELGEVSKTSDAGEEEDSDEDDEAPIVYAANLPNEYKHKDVVTLFAKFGPIYAVHRITNKLGPNSVIVVFDSPAGAEGALQAKHKALTLGENVLTESQAKDKEALNERTVVVALFGPDVTKEDIKSFIEKVAPVEDALSKSNELTLVVENVGRHEYNSCDALEKISKKCGELDYVDVVCSRAVFAFVTFKQPEGATKAIAELQGKTVNNVELKLKPYHSDIEKLKVQEEEKQIAATQSPSKRTRKQPVKKVPLSSEEESDAEEQIDDQVEDDSDSEAEDAADLIDDEAEEDEDENNDEEEDDDEKVELGEVSKTSDAGEEEDSDEDDETPVEEPVPKKGKESKKPGESNSEGLKEKSGIPKVSVGRIPIGTPKNRIVYAANLPNEYKHKDVVTLFAKFEPSYAVHRITNKMGSNSVIVAFDTPAGAEAALQVVALLGPNVTKEDIKSFIEKVVPVEYVTLTANRLIPRAFVRLESVDDIPKVLKLHSTELFSRFITVRPVSFKALSKSNELILVFENLGKHKSYSCDALEKIFKKCGELNYVDVVCSKTVLAFVTFKKPEGATKAIAQLQGKTVNNVELKLKPYHASSSGRAILVKNLTSDTTESDLRQLFTKTGEIESIQMLGIKAVIKFTTDEGLCKSFLANETIVNREPIFIEPNSLLKHRLMKRRIAKSHAPGKFQKDTIGHKSFNPRPSHENEGNPFIKRAKF